MADTEKSDTEFASHEESDVRESPDATEPREHAIISDVDRARDQPERQPVTESTLKDIPTSVTDKNSSERVANEGNGTIKDNQQSISQSHEPSKGPYEDSVQVSTVEGNADRITEGSSPVLDKSGNDFSSEYVQEQSTPLNSEDAVQPEQETSDFGQGEEQTLVTQTHKITEENVATDDQSDIPIVHSTEVSNNEPLTGTVAENEGAEGIDQQSETFGEEKSVTVEAQITEPQGAQSKEPDTDSEANVERKESLATPAAEYEDAGIIGSLTSPSRELETEDQHVDEQVVESNSVTQDTGIMRDEIAYEDSEVHKDVADEDDFIVHDQLGLGEQRNFVPFSAVPIILDREVEEPCDVGGEEQVVNEFTVSKEDSIVQHEEIHEPSTHFTPTPENDNTGLSKDRAHSEDIELDVETAANNRIETSEMIKPVEDQFSVDDKQEAPTDVTAIQEEPILEEKRVDKQISETVEDVETPNGEKLSDMQMEELMDIIEPSTDDKSQVEANNEAQNTHIEEDLIVPCSVTSSTPDTNVDAPVETKDALNNHAPESHEFEEDTSTRDKTDDEQQYTATDVQRSQSTVPEELSTTTATVDLDDKTEDQPKQGKLIESEFEAHKANEDFTEVALETLHTASSDLEHAELSDEGASSPKIKIVYATQSSDSLQFKNAEDLQDKTKDLVISPEHVLVGETEHQQEQEQQLQQPELNEPINSGATRDEQLCFTQALELVQERQSIEPLEDVLVDQVKPDEWAADTVTYVANVHEPTEDLIHRTEEQFALESQPENRQQKEQDQTAIDAGDSIVINKKTSVNMIRAQRPLYSSEDRDFATITDEEPREGQIDSLEHVTPIKPDQSVTDATTIEPAISTSQAAMLITTAHQVHETAELTNGLDTDEDKENNDRAEFEERYARLVSKLIPREPVFDSQQRKQRSKTLEPNFDINQLRHWNEKSGDIKQKSATLGRSESRKRPRLLPKPAVNDDHLFPNSVTPSKVDRNLSVRSLSVGLPEGTYDVPYIDDDAFVPRKFRDKSAQNGTKENDSQLSTDSDEYLWDPSLSRYSALDPLHRADIDECVSTPQLATKVGSTAPDGKHSKIRSLIKGDKNKDKKKRRLFDLCSCVGRRSRK